MTGNLAAFFFVLGLIAAFFLIKGKRERRYLLIAGAVGVLGGVIVFGLRLYDAKGFNLMLIDINRYALVIIGVGSLLLLITLLIDLFKKTLKGPLKIIEEIAVYLVVLVSFVYLSPQVIQYTQEFVYFGETALSTMALLRAVGYGVGVLLMLVLFFTTKKVGTRLKPVLLKLFLLLAVAVYFADYGSKAVGSLYRLHIIPLTDFIFKLIIFEDNHLFLFTYIQLAIAVMLVVYVIATHLKVKEKFKNNALLRKAKAYNIRSRRVSYVLLLTSILAVFTLSYLNYIDTKEVELAEPQEYQVEDNKIVIPLSDVNDGALHRFSYKTPNGYDVRFLVVKKPAGNAYGVGLDACEICGVAGYFERGEDVVCKRCDVVMNKNTIGFKGGCNPIPFPYVIENKKIYIDKADLEAEEEIFK